jgi:mevalonate kinase
MSKGKACGKFILLGEHFVVHGNVPALAFPLRDLWTEVKVSPSQHAQYSANIAKEFKSSGDLESIEAYMARATYAAADALRIDLSVQQLRIESTSNFPVARGVGSSASFSVALAYAMAEYRKSIADVPAETDELSKAAYAVEKIFHGKPSGIDTAVIFLQKPIRFENGAVVGVFENRAVDFVAIDSGYREGAATLIERISALRLRRPQEWEQMSNAMVKMTNDCEKALQEGQSKIVASIVREAHAILAELGLSTSKIDQIIEDGGRHGALAGKVSGAGGGGAVILVAQKGDGKRLASVMRENGCSVLAVESG